MADFYPKIAFICKDRINATFGCVIIRAKNYVLGEHRDKPDFLSDRLLAEAKKAEAEALKNAAEVKLPSTETTGLEGTVTVSQGAGYYAEILAYKAVEDSAAEIANKLENKIKDANSLIILGQTDLAEESALWNLLKIKLDAVKSALDSTIEKFPNQGNDYELDRRESLLVALAAAPAILGAAADIAAFFKTNRTITSRAVTIQEKALMAAVANKLFEKKNALKIILPERDLTGEGELHAGLKELSEKRNQLLAIREVLNTRFGEPIKAHAETLIRLRARSTVLNKAIDKAIADNKDTAELLKQLEQLELDLDKYGLYELNRNKIIAHLDKEITAADALIAAFTEKPSDKLSPLESVAAIEQIKKASDAKILYLLTVSQGGEIETSQSMFSQGRVSYIGGAIVSYVLTDANGGCICSGNETGLRTSTFKRSKGAVSMKEK